MTKKAKVALAAIISYCTSLFLLLYGLFILGTFSSDKIVIGTLATTGPDYEIILGHAKMSMQMPDTIYNKNLWGIMVAKDKEDNIGKYLENYWMYRHDYFVVTVKVVGAKQSDSTSFHPLVEVYDCRRIDYLILWAGVILDGILFFLFLIFSMRYSFLK